MLLQPLSCLWSTLRTEIKLLWDLCVHTDHQLVRPHCDQAFVRLVCPHRLLFLADWLCGNIPWCGFLHYVIHDHIADWLRINIFQSGALCHAIDDYIANWIFRNFLCWGVQQNQRCTLQRVWSLGFLTCDAHHHYRRQQPIAWFPSSKVQMWKYRPSKQIFEEC